MVTNPTRCSGTRGGFTLLELIISCALGSILVAAAFSFAGTQIRQMSVTTERLNIGEVGRSVLEMISDDVRHAGAGVGYAGDGTFAGLFGGQFQLGAVRFNSNDVTRLTLSGAADVPTDDIGIMHARGGYATLADYNAATNEGQMCDGAKFREDETVLLRSESGLAARSVVIASLRSVTCTLDDCVDGCVGFKFTPDPLWASDSAAPFADYAGGEIAGGFAGVVWFVESAGASQPLTADLRRAVFDGSHTCAARDGDCGELMARNIETLQMQVWRFDSEASKWINTTGQPLDTTDRLRVDIEFVLRARSGDEKRHVPVALRLAAGVCLPSTCETDYLERIAFRTSVEIMNSNRMAIR